MKYHITRENIEFEFKEDNLYSIVSAILKVLIPNKIKKLYFSGNEGNNYLELKSLENNGLTILNSNNDTTLLKKERIIHYNGYIVLVPLLSGIIKLNEWQPICEEISNEFQKNV